MASHLNPGRRLVISLMGTGNGAHVIAGLAGANPNYEVRLLTRRPEIFKSRQITVQRPGKMGGEVRRCEDEHRTNT